MTQRSRSMSYPLNPDPGDAVTRDTHIISPTMNPATAALETFLNKEPLCIDDGYDSCCSDGADYEEDAEPQHISFQVELERFSTKV